MSDIFLGYAREDLEIAEKVAGALERSGWSVFWDNEIAVGEDWERVLERELEKARCVVVLWSARSVVSEWVRAEAMYGRDKGKLVPAFIADIRPPLLYRGIQTANLVGWGGTVRHREFERLVSSIATLAGNPKGTPEYLRRVRRRARLDLVAAIEKLGFERSPRSDRVFYNRDRPGVRLVFLKTVVRVEDGARGGWKLRESFDLLKGSDRLLESLR